MGSLPTCWPAQMMARAPKRLGERSLRMALASICRMRSRVTCSTRTKPEDTDQHQHRAALGGETGATQHPRDKV